MTQTSTLPFDGAISRFHHEDAPADIRAAIANGGKRDILTPSYPYERWLAKDSYEAHMAALQIELARFKAWVEQTGARVLVLLEGRDTAGKSSAIKRIAENLNPRRTRIVALSAPTERERGQWYFQRYTAHLPAAGEMVLMDRSWYNRGVIEPVFGFCTEEERAKFFTQLPDFERTLTDDGIHVVKLWFNVGRAEQLRRMLERERHPLKQWKLSRIDVDGLAKWDAYTDRISDTLTRSDFPWARWTVIRGDDKYRARIAAIQRVLGDHRYGGRDEEAIATPDPQIVGGIDLWPRD